MTVNPVELSFWQAGRPSTDLCVPAAFCSRNIWEDRTVVIFWGAWEISYQHFQQGEMSSCVLGGPLSQVTLNLQVSLDTAQLVLGELIPRFIVHADIRLDMEGQLAARDWPSKLRGSSVPEHSQWLSMLMAWHLTPTKEQGTPIISCWMVERYTATF